MQTQDESKSARQATSALIVQSIQTAARSVGAMLDVEPQWGCVGQLTYASGIRRYFRLSTLDLNTMGASEIARDKGYTRYFLNNMGYPIPKGEVALSAKWAKKLLCSSPGGVNSAWKIAKSIGLPVFVKPNSLSRGAGVSKARTREEFRHAASQAFKLDRVIVIEEAVEGRDYRIVVLDGKVISAYERIPLEISGDGLCTIAELLNAKQVEYDALGRGTIIDRSDFRLIANLERAGYGYHSVLAPDQKMQLLDNANLSSGGTSIDVTEAVNLGFQEVVGRVAKDMGLRLVGVDLIVEGNLSMSPYETRYWILEVNSAPGLDHYASMGVKQQKIVDDLYLQVVQAMERREEAIFPPAQK